VPLVLSEVELVELVELVESVELDWSALWAWWW
jgi:hypothetical protein